MKIKETQTRLIVKMFSWTIAATLKTMLIVFLLTGDGAVSFSIGSIEIFAKLALYYFHERLWDIIPWGIRL